MVVVKVRLVKVTLIRLALGVNQLKAAKLVDQKTKVIDTLLRGEKVYQSFCVGCHGPVGDGQGPASEYIYPPPLNFTTLKRTGVSGGLLYYQIMNGITGTAMPYFKKALESEKIWDVSNFIAVYFIGETDANKEPKGIDASYEP